jgi:exosortase
VSTQSTQAIATPARQAHLLFGGLLAASVLIFWHSISDLIRYSFNHESSSHIVLIPFISAYLIYIERERIFSRQRYSLVLGLAVVVPGLILHFVAPTAVAFDSSEKLSATGLALMIVWIGAFIACYGGSVAKAAAFPLCFLIFMVPLPDVLLDPTIHALQEESTNISCLLFKMLGEPVLREGFVLTLSRQSIEVAKECSGIRSSMALLITCLLAGYLFLRTKWKVALFAVISVPVAIVKNGIRIVTLTMLSMYVNPAFLTGNLHHDGGFVFFLLALGILTPLFLVLEKSDRQLKSARAERNP